MKPETEKKIERTMKIVGLCVMSVVLLVLVYKIYGIVSSGGFSLESTLKKAAGNGEQYCRSNIINETTGIGFINYDCKPINRITKGIQRCKGQYYVFVHRLNGIWVVNESSKTLIW